MIVSSKAPKYNMRIPADVKEAIEKAAEAEGRSINTEMVMRLIDSLKKDGLFVLRNSEARRWLDRQASTSKNPEKEVST